MKHVDRLSHQLPGGGTNIVQRVLLNQFIPSYGVVCPDWHYPCPKD